MNARKVYSSVDRRVKVLDVPWAGLTSTFIPAVVVLNSVNTSFCFESVRHNKNKAANKKTYCGWR